MLPLTFYNGHRWSVWLNTNIVTTISMAFLGPLVVTIHTHKATLEDGSEKSIVKSWPALRKPFLETMVTLSHISMRMHAH